MPTFDTLSIGEARARSATGKRAAPLQEYAGYIERVGPGEAGNPEIGNGETTQAVRRRLSLTAQALGKRLEVRAHLRCRLLLGVGWTTSRQAEEEPQRVVSAPHPGVSELPLVT